MTIAILCGQAFYWLLAISNTWKETTMPANNRADLKTPEWRQLRQRILERDAHTCGYCGGEADTVDHIIPVSAGGGVDPSNLMAACNRCNGLKANKVHARVNWVSPRWGVRLN